MVSLAHLKRRLGQYAAVWVGAFLLSGAAILTGLAFTDLMTAADLVLPVGLALTVLALAGLLVLPLLWAPVSAAVAIAFFADRSIEYSQAYAAFQIGVSQVLFPVSRALGDGDLFGWVWGAFQWVSTVVGFLAALVKLWPVLRRLLGPEPVEET